MAVHVPVRTPLGPLVAMLAGLVALAGCADPDAPGGPGDGDVAPAPDDGTADAFAAPPPWAVGDHWVYDAPFGATDYIVTGDQGADWFLDTSNEDTAFLDARDDISRLGPVRKSDLAGSQGSDRVEFFRWPLTDGESWVTRWDGMDVTITATGPQDGVFTFEAHNATHLAYSYTYDPEAGWFGALRHHGTDGSVDFELVLDRAGHNFTGTVVRWSLETLAEFAGRGSVFHPGAPTVAEGVTDLWLEYSFQCTGTAGYAVVLKPAAETAVDEGHTANGPCADVAFQDVVQAAPTPGPWLFFVDVGGGPEDPVSSWTLLARTRQDVPVGP